MFVSLALLASLLTVRFIMTKEATQMSYLASKTVKRVMREQIYGKILRLGNTYREHATTAELVQESVEGVEQLEIRENTFTGIVGESGSGKSTIASLIMGRNSVKRGLLTIAGINVSDINEDSLFKNINYVGIGSTFFRGNVRENLLLAYPDASEEELWNVLAECEIDGFFRGEKGLDTLFTENAGNLSGGQKQRLALARAILHDAKVYIFDEATSNIDIESEELILSEIKKLAKTKTVIMITHRLSNVRDADENIMEYACLVTSFICGVTGSIPMIALMSSFGPVTALAALGTTLQSTVASGARVLAIIDEEPETEDIKGKAPINIDGAEVKDVSFAYAGKRCWIIYLFRYRVER